MMATGMQGLLVWCKIITKPYGDDIAVKNMTTSWKNGLAFCAIIHHFRPDLIDFNKLSKENIAENNALAFTKAEEELGIPALLDVEDMVQMKVPDRLSIMTYVSQYYNYFKDKVPGEIEPKRGVSKKRSTKDPSESLPAKRGLDEHHITPVMQKTIPVKKNICCSCGKTVYLMERFSIEGKLFHRICFKCTVCGKQLKNSTYEYDKVGGKFYCTKDYNDRKGKDVQVDKNDVPSTHPDEEMEHSDVAETKSHNLKKTLKSPFKRNEPFKRQGIHPQPPPTSPADEGVVNTIKSKEESTKVTGKGKPTKSFFAGVRGKKQHEFTNPSYDKQLDLSSYMNKLNDPSEPILLSSHEDVHPDLGATDNYEQINMLPRVTGHKSVSNENSEQTSNEKNKKDKESKGKKLVLKIKRKKDKKAIAENTSKENDKNVQNSKIKSDTPLFDQSTLSKESVISKESEYENLGKYMKMNSVIMRDNADKIYDNVNLCKVITKNEPDLKIYDNCNLQPILHPPNKDEVNKYGDDRNIYEIPNVGGTSKNNLQGKRSSEPMIYEHMGTVPKETSDSKANIIEDSDAQYVCVTRNGHVKCTENTAGNAQEDIETSSEYDPLYMCVTTGGHIKCSANTDGNAEKNSEYEVIGRRNENIDNKIIDRDEQNEIIQNNINDPDLINVDTAHLHDTDNENMQKDNYTDIKNADLIEDTYLFVDDNNPQKSEIIVDSDNEMELDNISLNLDDIANGHVSAVCSLTECNDGVVLVSSEFQGNKILDANQVGVCDESFDDNQVKHEGSASSDDEVEDEYDNDNDEVDDNMVHEHENDMVVEESSKDKTQDSMTNASNDTVDIQNDNQQIPCNLATKSNDEELIENSNEVTKNDEIGQSYLDIRANLRTSKLVSNENVDDDVRLQGDKMNEDHSPDDHPTSNVYTDVLSSLRKTSDTTPGSKSTKTKVDENREMSRKTKTAEEILIEARLSLGSTGRLEGECEGDDIKATNLEAKIKDDEGCQDSSVQDSDSENGKPDETEHMDTEITTGMNNQVNEDVFKGDMYIHKPSNEGVAVHAQTERCPLIDSDLNDNLKETNDNSSDNELYLTRETDTHNIVEGEMNKIDKLSDHDDSVILCEENIDDEVKFKTSSLADDQTSEQINVIGDPSVIETNDNLEDDSRSTGAFNPFLSSDSSPEMPPKKTTTNPFLSSSDEATDDDDGFISEEFDESNPFAEDVRLEKRKSHEKPKNKPSRVDLFQIGIIEETNPFADDVLDPTNPFSDEYDAGDDLSIAETTHEMKLSRTTETSQVPQIVGSIPKTDKKLVLKTKHGNTVRKNSAENSLNSTPNHKPRRKKRAAPVPPVSASVPNTPIPSNRQSSRKKRAAPKPPDASNVNKCNSFDSRRGSCGNSFRKSKRKAPEPPEKHTFDMKGELDDTCDDKSVHDLSNVSNVIDNAQSVSKDEDISEKYDVTTQTECDSIKGDGQSDAAGSGKLTSSIFSAENSSLDTDSQFSVDDRKIDMSISDVNKDLEDEEQLEGNTTTEASNVSIDTSSDLSRYTSANQSFFDTSVSHLHSEEQMSLNSTEDLANKQESDVSSVSYNIQLPVEQDYVKEDIDMYTPGVHSDTESKENIFNSTTDLSNLAESNISIASSRKSVDSSALEEHVSSNLSMETQGLNADNISSSKSISSNQEDSSTECDGDIGIMNEHRSIYENTGLEHLKIGTTNSLPHTKHIANSEFRSSLPNIYSSNRQSIEKRKAPPKPPRQYKENDSSNESTSPYKQSKREEMAKELQFLEVKQRELEMEGVVMEKKLRECSSGEPEDAYLLTWFELVNQKNQLLRRENELIYMCQEIDLLQNQRNAEFELRQLMMKPDDEKTEYDTNREAELLAEILRFVTRRSNIIDKMDEDRIREYEEDQEISSMMAAQGLKSSTMNLNEKGGHGEKKKKGKEKPVKEKKESKLKKKSKEKMESNGTTFYSGKEKKTGNFDKIKKKSKQERKESKEKCKKVSKDGEVKKK